MCTDKGGRQHNVYPGGKTASYSGVNSDIRAGEQNRYWRNPEDQLPDIDPAIIYARSPSLMCYDERAG